jgi:hypothetical protein
MLKQAWNSALIKKNTSQSQNVTLLCKRIGVLNLTPRLLFHTTTNLKEEQQEEKSKLNQEPIQTYANYPSKLSPHELLRKEALKIRDEASLRARCAWLKEEDEKLLDMVNTLGRRWSFIAQHFVNRPPSTLLNRHALLINENSRGPWEDDEVKVLKELGKNRSPGDIDNWKEIQAKLPRPRPMYLIKQKYAASLNPNMIYGRWSDEESDKLAKLVAKYGEKEMDKVATLMGTRSRRQCLERWRWQMASTKKGRFTEEEDIKIKEAINKYGENFAVIAKVIGSDRTPRHISQHYRNLLEPNVDRSPWTLEEQSEIYNTCLRNNGNMTKTKKQLNSKRAIRDLWNHYHTHQKYLLSNSSKKEQVAIKAE